MNCYQVLTEINKKCKAENLPKSDDTSAYCHMLSIFKPVHRAFYRRGQIVFIVA